MDYLFESCIALSLYSVHRFKKGDAFIGFQSQTPATVVLQARQSLSGVQDTWHDDVSVSCE